MTTANRQKVLSIIKNNLPDPSTSAVTPDTALADIGMDSMSLVEAIFELEETFDIFIPNPGENKDLDTEFTTVGEVISAVEQLIGEQKVVG